MNVERAAEIADIPTDWTPCGSVLVVAAITSDGGYVAKLVVDPDTDQADAYRMLNNAAAYVRREMDGEP